jgi:hypothetical protein
MKYLGNDYDLQIESAVPGVYTTIKGQINLSVNRSAATVGSTRAGQASVSIPATIIPDLPDATGYGRLITQMAARTPFNIQIVNTADSDTVEFQGSVTVSDRSNSLDRNSPAGGSCTFINAAAPVIDLL